MKILITDPLAPEAVEMLEKEHQVTVDEMDHDTLLNSIGEYDALMVRGRTKARAEIVEAGTNLKVIGRAGVGVDNVDIATCTAKGIKVVNAPTGATESVAELTFAHMLALARRIGEAHISMKAGRWDKKKLKGTELSGKMLGLVAMGRIGYEVAKRAKAFGMDFIVYDPYIGPELVEGIGGRLVQTLDEVIENADFISIHSPLTDETRHMIGADVFARMKNTAYIFNCARGGIIDEDALYEALTTGQIAGAGLDVFENEPPEGSRLMELDNVVFTPHLGASTRDAQVKAGTICADQVLKVLAGKKPEFIVNRELL